MRKAVALLSIFFLLQHCTQKSPVYYIDQNFPDSVPKIFAPGLVSKPDRLEQNLTMSGDGKEYYFGITDSLWGYSGIVSVRVDSGKVVADTLFYHPRINHCGEPFLLPDGQTLYLVGNHPFDIWVCHRDKETGEWSFPENMKSPVNTEFMEAHPSFSESETLFFTSTRDGSSGEAGEKAIYCSDPTFGEYEDVEKLEGGINSADAVDPCIAADESYIIFGSTREGGYGETDLYISFSDGDTWSAPKNLGSQINTAAHEGGAFLSPDEKYLFFYRREKRKSPAYSDIYWVSTDFLRELE